MGIVRILSEVSHAVSALTGATLTESDTQAEEHNQAGETLNSLILDCMNCRKTLEQDIYIMAAVALSVFHSDGVFSAAEEQMIDDFLQGLSSGAFSPALSERIRSIKSHPPGFTEIMELVKTLPREKWVVIDRIINISARADSVITEQEIEYLRIWNEIYKPE